MNIFESIITSGQNLDKKATRKCKCNKSLHEDKDDDNTEVIDARDDVVVVEPEEEEEIDDAVVVVDPDISMDDLVDNLENLQDILDATVDNEVATSDEYVDDHIYACPVCGNNFFSEEPMEDGEACPVCGDTPDGYVLVGTVEDPKEAAEEIEAQTDAEEAGDAIDDVAAAVDAARDEIDDLQDDEEDKIEDLEVEESKKIKSIKGRLKSKREFTETMKRLSAKRSATRAASTKSKDLTLDESKLNALMTDYASKTYKGVKCMEVKKVTLVGSNLVCECVITTASGKKHRAAIKFEGFTTSKSINKTKGKLECKAIATTSKYPFLLESKIVKGQIIPVAFRYNYVVSEGKRIHGKSVIEKKMTDSSKARFVGEAIEDYYVDQYRGTIDDEEDVVYNARFYSDGIDIEDEVRYDFIHHKGHLYAYDNDHDLFFEVVRYPDELDAWGDEAPLHAVNVVEADYIDWGDPEEQEEFIQRYHRNRYYESRRKTMAEKKFESIILGSQKKSLKESRNPRVKKLREGAKETSDQLVYAFYKGSRTAADELANPEDAYPDEVREAIRAGVDALNATPDEVVFRTTDQLWFHQDFKLEDVVRSIVANGTPIFANDIYAVYKGKFRDLPIIVIHYLPDDEPYMPELVMFVGDNEYAEKETARQRAAKEAEAEVDEDIKFEKRRSQR